MSAALLCVLISFYGAMDVVAGPMFVGPQKLLLSHYPQEKERVKPRYFTSEIECIDDKYAPVLKNFLFDKDKKPLYQQWSVIYYPAQPPYDICLVRVIPRDDTVVFDPAGYIEEITTRKQWKMLKKHYRFEEKMFGKY